MIISAIFAISENGVIGKDNGIPWKMPADIRRFKRITKGHSVIMGRYTYESVGRPLKNRRNIIVSRKKGFAPEGCEVVSSLSEAIALCEGEKEVFLVGGSGIYHEGFEKGFTNKIYKTIVHADIEGDVFLNLPDESQWKITEVESHQADEKNEYAYTYIDQVKIGN